MLISNILFSDGGVEVGVSDLFMILWRNVFYKIIRVIVDALVPKQVKLFSFYSVSAPIYIHIKIF